MNKKLYYLFTDQCEPSLKTKPERAKGYDKAHITPDGIKLLEFIMSVVYGVEVHLKGPWAIMKANKRLYMFLHRKNKTKNDCMEFFNAYIKFIKSYVGNITIHPGLVKSKLTKMRL